MFNQHWIGTNRTATVKKLKTSAATRNIEL